MKKILLIALMLCGLQGFSQKADTIWFKNNKVLACRILSFDTEYISYDLDNDNDAAYSVTRRDSVIKFYTHTETVIEPTKPVLPKITYTQAAGYELKKASTLLYIGSALSLVGTGVTIGGAFFRNYTVYPNGTIEIHKMGNDVLKVLGSAILLAGTITTYASFSHIWKAGSILVSGDGVGVAVKF